ncbi:sporulation kinase A [bacterium BMS3Abin04]|nr:sporulation kinase A [bacterium BMS3Abin04]
MNKRQFYLPLFWKFTIAIILIVFVFGGVNAYLIFQNVQKSLEKESEKRAIDIGKSLADQVVTPLLFEDYVGVQKILDGAKQLDSTVIYAFITDKNQDLISSSSDFGVSLNLIKANKLTQPSRSKVLLIDLFKKKEHKIIRDIAWPILEGELGTVRIGISEERINKDIINTISRFWMMVGVFLIVGIIGAFSFSYFITKPIKKIQNAADNLELNSLSEAGIPKIEIRKKLLGKIPIFFRARDEIDLLTEKFNDMGFRLAEAYKELKEAETKLIQSEKLATIGTVSAGLAHEINNPISGIKNCLRRMNNDPLNVEQNKKYLALMNQASKRIETVIKNLLNYSRLEDIKFEKVNIKEQIENALLLLAYRFELNRIIITKDIPFKKKFVFGSKTHLEQVIVNLLVNSIDAIEASPENNSYTISISLIEENEFIKLTINDSGVGIHEKELGKIFEPFYTTKATGKGTGLGLSIIYNIVNSHNGKITVKSKVGVGTTTYVFLPKFKGI